MLKKIFQFIVLLSVIGFSFFYTDKAVKIARKSDPIMIQINNVKDDMKIDLIDPVINDDEYKTGINGCSVDEQKSYTKMKETGTFNSSLIVLKEDKIKQNSNNKYITGGNDEKRNVSIIFILDNKLDSGLLNHINNKKIKVNFFVDGNFLENNLDYVKSLSKYSNIYNLGRNRSYSDKYLIYDNNLIETISHNDSLYCLSNKKDKKQLKMCKNFDMKMINSKYIENDIYETTKNYLENGHIFVYSNLKSIDEIKVSINHILSKGYNIVDLESLLSENNDCK